MLVRRLTLECSGSGVGHENLHLIVVHTLRIRTMNVTRTQPLLNLIQS